MRRAKPDVAEAFVSVAQKPQYEIWTTGAHEIVDDISEFEQKKEGYLFWIDLNDRPPVLEEDSRKHLGTYAVNLLLYLVRPGRFGRLTSLSDILREVWQIEKKEPDDLDKGRIAQYLAQLQKFSRGKFHKHLLEAKRERGLGLKESFKDKYFIFRRVS